MKRLLSLPLTKDEFLATILHRLPDGFESRSEGYDEIWSKPGEKKLKIRFSDFSMIETKSGFPRRLVMENKGNLFELKWQKVEVNF